jgi:hypothetical protein
MAGGHANDRRPWPAMHADGLHADGLHADGHGRYLQLLGYERGRGQEQRNWGGMRIV